ncbi:RAMP superfamily CRISPR-associated protein [Cylindrospermopsis raciborskii]|jgi:CRISPR-associated protein Cmr6|uniref:RAMP superfamily CRISPR-associated protein n=1 Tax=Cylindrospermopsis raciborskii TaxID=77022 RepID=UPI001F198FAE|nr:RAMP superfamily CRISPR-associated protein [Cylindrospermopsis raciborskii]UJS04761.1 RAMP superfamily CRISPR-associated protein [Cylindrospermopsis raciborskii KLL07]
MVFDRGPKPGNNQPNKNQAPQRQQNQHKNIDEEIPSPWLERPDNTLPEPDQAAGFVEYLRWMRAAEYPDKDTANISKLRILQMIEKNANYSDRLGQLNKRTELIAGENNCFPVTCPWRIRVGGHRGPESTLLPAFDALGMPFIPSSTLRGVARHQAIEDFIKQGKSLQEAETEVMKYFGGLNAIERDHTGKVIFLDAYPTPTNKAGGLSVDITNNIWEWGDNNQLNYKPNPQAFLSLQKAEFLIGIRPTSYCKPNEFTKIKEWLSSGLQNGIGSQVNTGYGTLVTDQNQEINQYFWQISFTLKGQLIHGIQKFKKLNNPYEKNDRVGLKKDTKNNLKPDTSPVNEVRSIAFKSMLRYWFRALASGVLSTTEVKTLEAILFGAITPQTRGWVKFQITNSEIIPSQKQGNSYTCGEQSGKLILSYSSEAPLGKQNAIKKLFTNLTWMMFHLGGVGQGARRPCYSRQNRANPKPPWRGSTLIPESEDKFWELPETIREFQKLFRQRLQEFYDALKELTGHNINYQQLRTVGQVRLDKWSQALDSNCRIIVCTGDANYEKPYALTVLHQKEFKQDVNVCGKAENPSPVWIADLDNYQVVTVFGVTVNNNPRHKFVQTLRDGTSTQEFAQIFPLP